MWAAENLCVADCVADRVRLAVPQPAKWQHVGNQIKRYVYLCADSRLLIFAKFLKSRVAA
jgi:hypothetical protein